MCVCVCVCVCVCICEREDAYPIQYIIITRKGSKAYLSSSERYLTLHIIRHRP